MEGKEVSGCWAPPCVRPTPEGCLKETEWLKGYGGVDGGILVGVAEV